MGKEVAGIWFDDGERVYRISTVPLMTFKTVDEALQFWNRNCDPETGIQSMRRQPGSTKKDPQD